MIMNQFHQLSLIVVYLFIYLSNFIFIIVYLSSINCIYHRIHQSRIAKVKQTTTNGIDSTYTSYNRNQLYRYRGYDIVTSSKPLLGGKVTKRDTVKEIWPNIYKQIPLDRPKPGITPPYSVTVGGKLEDYPNGQFYSYTPNDCSVGDVDGDGKYEIIVKWESHEFT